MPSPKPRPAALKLLNGERPGRDSGGRKVEPAPGFVRVSPVPPSDLPVAALEEWQRIVPELDRLRIVANPSRMALTALVTAWWAFDSARRVAQDVMDDPAVKALDRTRAIAMLSTASKDLRAWVTEFGLTPSSEGRLRVPEADDGGNDFD